MTEDQALIALGRLVAVTTGWNDRAIEQYAHELITLNDAEALDRACEVIARTWAEARRPPLAEILTTYNREVGRTEQRRRAEQRAIEWKCATPEEGVAIARAAYEKECRLLGRAPNDEHFDRIMRAIVP